MAYHIYTTRGIVLSQRAIGEADRVYSILTRDFGLLRARALAVRKASSKLRGILEPFSLSSVSLVRGKDYWRLTSAELVKKIPNTASFARPLALLERLIQGEAPQPELFDTVESSAMIYHSGADLESETQLVAKILYHLGYLRESYLNLPRKELIKAINQGLQHSQLT